MMTTLNIPTEVAAHIPKPRSTLLPHDPVVRRSLCFLALFQFVMWTAVPMFAHLSPSLDIIEGFAWGNAWQLGYFKHPPLSPWLTAASASLFGKNLFAVYILSPLAILTALAFVWTLSREFFDEKISAVSLYLVASQLYFNLLTPEFNHNVMQIPLWAAAFALYWRAVTRGALIHFATLGVVLGLCALAKYSAVLLYAVLGGFTLFNPHLMRQLRLSHVLVCMALATAIAAPNAIWQVANDFPSMKYASDRMGEKLAWNQRPLQALQFVAEQAGMLLPLIVATLIAGRRTKRDIDLPSAAHTYVRVIAFGPALLVLAMILFAGNAVRTMWGATLFTTAGLVAILWLGSRGADRLFSRRWWLAWLAASLMFLTLYATMVHFGPLMKNRVSRAVYPGREVAAAIEQDWRTRTTSPLRYAVGDVWMAGIVAFFAQETPQVFIDSDRRFSPWIDPARLAACGAVLVWEQQEGGHGTPDWLRAYPAALAPSVKRFSVANRSDLYVEVGWAIVPPQGHCPAG